MIGRNGEGRTKAGSVRFIVILATISALGPFSLDMYLPAMPAMADALEANPSLLQMTITGYLIGVAVGPLFLGPLSDAWGRIRAQTLFLLLYAVMSVACALAPNAEALIGFRIAQAVAAGAAMTSSRAMLSDVFAGDALSRATSLMMTIFTLGPVLAPMLGAWILIFAGWRGIFGALVVLSLAACLLMRLLPETLPPERRRPYAARAVVQGYVGIMRQPAARRYLGSTFSFAFMFFGMLAASPFIFIDHFGMSPQGFGYLFASISAAALGGNILNARLVFRFGYERMLAGATVALGCVGAAMALIVATGAGGLWGVYAGMLLLMAIFHISIANTLAGVMRIAADRAGAASAALAFWRFLGGALGTVTVGAFNTSHPWPLALAICVAAVGAAAALTLWRAGAPDAR
ncbi:multidrug effflux MFS transporter [Pikeienuella piscinae]|uniref:Bcr/CflA family efflux transporter n=1 Tax=Pikeienuella piscinae TaxID=2748098 RepID=A0A7M3T5U1_9RHOB|nr:multidrug effflux MFS transporter [Pikeienuella piscinae]QIE57372.1 multidrug effflux MFS transporter [Pikeienuella piscinae]